MPNAPLPRSSKPSSVAEGAVTVDGKMVDYANVRMIRRLLSFRE